jgi:hypothetical protein
MFKTGVHFHERVVTCSVIKDAKWPRQRRRVRFIISHHIQIAIALRTARRANQLLLLDFCVDYKLFMTRGASAAATAS